jgi:hypothetical protein
MVELVVESGVLSSTAVRLCAGNLPLTRIKHTTIGTLGHMLN